MFAWFSLLILFLLSGCAPETNNPNAVFLTQPAPSLTAAKDSPFLVFFTDPYAPNAGSRTEGADETIVAAIDAAQQTVDLAIYNFSLPNIAEALLHAQQRGVDVRVVMESDNIDGNAPQYLMENGIEVLGDRRESLMHNKYLVIDGSEVWVASFNLTAAGIYNDHNHALRLQSVHAAQNYTTEFEEMFIDDRFGAGSPANTPHPRFSVAGRTVEVLFSPDDGVARRLVALVENAQESVVFLAFSFTADDIAAALLERAAAGIAVRGVLDAEQAKANTGGEWQRFRSVGLKVRLDGSPGQMHHKVMVIDRQIVVLGSYNFSASAEKRNDENVMIVYDAALAGQFIAEFERLYAAGKEE